MERTSGLARLPIVTPASEPDHDDAALVHAFACGQGWAARAIWSRHAPMVHRLLERALGPDSDAEDLTQEVFLTTFARMPTLRDTGALRSFIYSIALRRLKWELRRRRVRRILRLSPTGRAPELPVQAADSEARQLLERFYFLLDQLGAGERTVFVLRHMEGLKLEEIADQLGISLATVKRWLNRGTKRVSVLVDADRELSSYMGELDSERGRANARR